MTVLEIATFYRIFHIMFTSLVCDYEVYFHPGKVIKFNMDNNYHLKYYIFCLQLMYCLTGEQFAYISKDLNVELIL